MRIPQSSHISEEPELEKDEMRKVSEQSDWGTRIEDLSFPHSYIISKKHHEYKQDKGFGIF